MLMQAPKSFTMIQRVGAVIASRARFGATTDEVASLIGTTPNVISGRMMDLRKKNFIIEKLGLDGAPETRKTRTGKDAKVYVSSYYKEPF